MRAGRQLLPATPAHQALQQRSEMDLLSRDFTAFQGLGAMTGTVAIAALRASLESAWSTILPPRYASYLREILFVRCIVKRGETLI
jgi:hypothetical protein